MIEFSGNRRLVGAAGVAMCLGLALLAAVGCGNLSSRGGKAGSSEARLIGHRGRQPGQFTHPRAVVAEPGGRVVVIDRSGRVQTMNIATGEFETGWRLPGWDNGTPTGISLDPYDDTIWIADTHYQRILQYAPDGTLLQMWGEDGNNPGQLIFPTDVVPDPDGQTLWICEYGDRSRIMHFTREGVFLNEWTGDREGHLALERPMSMAVDKDGDLVVADAANHRIVVYATNGDEVRSWGEAGTEPGQLSYPYDLSIGADGTYYIVEYGNSRVSRFTPDGKFLGCWGTPGYGPGELFSPWGIALADDGTMIIADTYNHRLQVVATPAQRMHGGVGA